MTVSEFLTEAFSRCNVVKNSYFYTFGSTELDYASFRNIAGDGDHIVAIDDWFDVVLTPGACEGAYIEIYMWQEKNHETTRSCVGTIKTLQTSLSAYQDLGRLCGEMMYHLQHINIHGK